MIELIIFIIFLIIFVFFVNIITRKWFNSSFEKGLSIAFLFKVILGCLYGFYFKNNFAETDTWTYFFNGIKLNSSHWHNAFQPSAGMNFNLFSSKSYYEYYRNIGMDMFSGLLSLISDDCYYVNLIIFNFITFLGILQLYRFLLKINPQYKIVFFGILFFYPPFVFWTSGFHRDGLLMAALGIALYNIQLCLTKFKIRTLIWVLISIGFMLFMRSFWGGTAIIVTGVWFVLSYSGSKRPLLVFSLFLISFIVLFFIAGIMPVVLNGSQILIAKQHAFLNLHGNSEMAITKLSERPMTFIQAGIEGINHLLFRPYISEIDKSPLYVLVFLENVLIWALIILVVILKIKNKGHLPMAKPENSVLLFLVIIGYIIIGLTVPFLGAIVRYKAPFEVLLIIVLIQFIPIESLNRIIPVKKREQFGLPRLTVVE